MRVVVTGGAGFIGSSVAIGLVERHPGWTVVAADNLYRRGAELNVPRLRAAGVAFQHADVRIADDVAGLGRFDALVECSAEPSVLAGTGGGDARYLVSTNLAGAAHCFDACARHGAQVVFLSTSRVYPVAALDSLATTETATRFELDDAQPLVGASAAGIAECFPLAGPRSLYGATKLAAEVLLTDYAATYGFPAVVDRCGVVAGPWQMGKVDQGVFTYWLLAAHTGRRLRYIGYGGSGKQVRDLLHVDDLVRLVDEQLTAPDHWEGRTFNVGGGRAVSLSLRETTSIVEDLVGRSLDVGPADEERPGDVRVYLSDCSTLFEHTAWRPERDPADVLGDIHRWLVDHRELVLPTLV